MKEKGGKMTSNLLDKDLEKQKEENIGGRLCIVGSTQIFCDDYLEKEENSKLLEVIISFLTDKADKSMDVDSTKTDESEINEYTRVPDIGSLSNGLRSCLQETEELPRDFTMLFNMNLFK